VRSSAATRTPFREFLTTKVNRIQPQGFQCLHTSVQQESHPIHVAKIHVTESDTTEQVTQQVHSRGSFQHQPSSQWRGEGWDNCRTVYLFALRIIPIVDVFEVFQVLE